MPLPPTYKFCSIPALIGLYTKFGSDPQRKNNLIGNLGCLVFLLDLRLVISAEPQMVFSAER